MLWSLCRSVDRLGRTLTEEEEELINEFVYVFGREAGTTLHPSYRTHEYVYPRGFEQGLWKKSMLIDLWNKPVLIPRGDSGDYDEPEIFREIEVEVRGSRVLTLAKQMGWVELDAIYDTVIPSVSPDRFESWLSGELRPHYTLFVKRCCPGYLYDLMHNQLPIDVAQLQDLYDVEIEM